MRIKRDTPLEDGIYRVRLVNIEEKETIFGRRLMWLFEELSIGTEIAGFTSLSESTQASAYKRAVALNPEIENWTSWEFEDVIGRECYLELEKVQGSKGPKNKIVEVLPVEEE